MPNFQSFVEEMLMLWLRFCSGITFFHAVAEPAEATGLENYNHSFLTKKRSFYVFCAF